MDGSWTEVATMTTAAVGANWGAVYVPVLAPIEPLLFEVVQVVVPFVVMSTHQVTAVLVVPVTLALNGKLSCEPMVALFGDTERVMPEDSVTTAAAVIDVSAAATAVTVTVQGVVGVGVHGRTAGAV